MNDTIEIFVEGVGKEILTQQNYLAGGGEGNVYQKGGTAYKIFHSGKEILQRQKLAELNQIKADNVLIPLKFIFDSKKKNIIGFTMRYIHATEFLCKLFNTGFLNDHNIDSKVLTELIKNMQLTLNKVHEAKCLVVDFNQMNFLTDNKKYTTPYFIDAGCYQTQSFKATAIMDCIRDREVSNNSFSELSDWYSWAVVTFWLYTGIHPYRGNHPDYNKSDWNGKRMDDRISIFDKDVEIPTGIRDFSTIPKSYFEWYKSVFKHNQRSVPPLPDGQIITQVQIKIKDIGNFFTKLIATYDTNIRHLYSYGDTRFAVTQNTVYRNSVPIYKFSNADKVGFISVDNSDPCLVLLQNNDLSIIDMNKNICIHKLYADDMMSFDGKTYTRTNDSLIKHSCDKFEKIVHSVEEICNVFSSTCKLYDLVAVQDMVGKCWVTFPIAENQVINVEISELNQKRIVDAKQIKRNLVVVTEEKGKFFRYVIVFGKDSVNYTVRKEEVDGNSAEFVIKQNGLCIAQVDQDLETWNGNQYKQFKNSPIPVGSKMYTENNKTMFVVGNKLYELGLK